MRKHKTRKSAETAKPHGNECMQLRTSLFTTAHLGYRCIKWH